MAAQLVSDKIITLEPSRNLLSFNKFDEINHQIINEYLESLLVLLQLIIPIEFIKDGKTTIEIRRNRMNYSLKLRTKNDKLIKTILDEFLEDAECCYLEVNGDIHKKGVYKDILSLEYNPRSFRQPDDSIRDYMIYWMQKHVSRGWDSMVFFGGECTLLGKILDGHSKSHYFYTDFPSIYDDIFNNYRYVNSRFTRHKCRHEVELIDYKVWRCPDFWLLDLKDERKCCIVNTGYHGMGANLAAGICKIDSQEIYVISCNTESWNKDFLILKNFYNLLEQVEIRTNYSIWIYKLSRKTHT
jgi:hypothetical protein